MAHSDANRPTSRPLGNLGRYSLQPVALPLESESPPREIASEDFLYHLSRGSELLKENRVEDAKVALELALSLQPLDLRGQGLLGVVYFRLGLYPRAIEIYRQIVEALDEEISPKVNLSLCYVKTGQHHAARELLEEVVRREPEHHRAWAYLGLVFQFQRDYAKAESAFERARQPSMAERMRHLAAALDPALREPALTTSERRELQAAARGAFEELDAKSDPFLLDGSKQSAAPMPGKWHATEPGEESIPADRRQSWATPLRPPSLVPPPLPSPIPAELSEDHPTQLMGDSVTKVRDALSANRAVLCNWMARHRLSWSAARANGCCTLDARTLAVELIEPFAVRASAVVMLSPTAVAKRELRLLCERRDNSPGEPLGGARSPIVGFTGPGKLLARVTTGQLELIELTGDSLIVQKHMLFGLSLGLSYEFQTLRFQYRSLEIIRLGGRGLVALQLPSTPVSLEVMSDALSHRDLAVRIDELVGWTARVQLESVDSAEAPGHSRDFIALSGDGTAIVC
ncbi:MAG TPA: tetratricopeptide repeat protein [Polyangiaceae bacterium]